MKERKPPGAWPWSPVVIDLRDIAKGADGVVSATVDTALALAAHPAIESRMARPDDAAFRAALRKALPIALKDVHDERTRKTTAWYLGLTKGAARQSPPERLKYACSKFLGLSVSAFQHERQPEGKKWKKSRYTRALMDVESSLDVLGPYQPRASTAASYDLLEGYAATDVFEAPEQDAPGRLEAELLDSHQRGASTWWEPEEGVWMGRFYLQWHSCDTTACERIAIRRNGGQFDASVFGVADKFNGDKARLTILQADAFHNDDEDNWGIDCGVTNWNFAYKWARKNGDQLLTASGSSSPSVFGVTDRRAYPGIAGLAALVETSDKFLMFSLRGGRVSFYPETWSASFEESLAPEKRKYVVDRPHGDVTLLDTLEAGLDEEFGVPRTAVASTSLLGVGRQYARSDPTKAGLDLSSTVVAAARLNIGLDQFWAYLQRARHFRKDVSEHRAWVGVKFADRAQLLRFLAFANDRVEGTNIFTDFANQDMADIDVRPLPGTSQAETFDRGLHVTSAARLCLGSAWLETLD